VASAGTVTVDFAAETAKFSAELKKVRNELALVRKDTALVSSTVSAAAGAFKAFISAGAIVGTLRAVIRETSAAQAAQAQLNNALATAGAPVKAASAEFQAYASQLQRTTTFGDEAIQEVETLLLSFQGLSGGVVKEATAAVLDLSTRMGIDAPSAAKLLGKALSDPEAGLAALKKAGVLFTDSQKDQIKVMQQTGDLAGAQAVILKTLEDRFGGAAAAARDTFGGALAGLKNAFGDLLEGGSGVNATADAINNLTDVLGSDEVKSGFNLLITAMTKVIEGWALLAGIVGKAFEESNPQLDAAFKEQEKLSLAIGRTSESMQEMRADGKENTRQFSLLSNQLALYKTKLAELRAEIQRQLDDQSLEKGVEVSAKRIRPRSGSALDFTTGGDEGDLSPVIVGDQVRKLQEARAKLMSDLFTQTAADAVSLEETLAQQSAAAIQAGNDIVANEIANDQFRDQLREGWLAKEQAADEARVAAAAETEQRIVQFRNAGINSALNLLQVFFGRHKAVALALFLIQKRQAIAETIIATKAAVIQTYKNAGGYPWGIVPAAAMAALGAAQIAEMVATNPGTSGLITGGGTGGSAVYTPGSPNNPIFTDSGSDAQRGATAQRVTQIVINNNGYITEDIARQMIEQIKDQINDRDVVIINGNSRQAQELRG
jgi:hypothetical protein